MVVFYIQYISTEHAKRLLDTHIYVVVGMVLFFLVAGWFAFGRLRETINLDFQSTIK